MKSSLGGVAGFACLLPSRAKKDKNPADRKFVYRTLGRTGIRVPVIGMGMLLSGNADLMLAYMYAYGYRQPALARSLLASQELPGRICEDCPSCPIMCLNQWDVRAKVRDIVRLRDGLLI